MFVTLMTYLYWVLSYTAEKVVVLVVIYVFYIFCDYSLLLSHT